MSEEKPWTLPMPEEQFDFMRQVLAAPSPVGFEAGMTHGVVKPAMAAFKLEDWGFHQYRGNAGLVLDSAPGRTDLLTVMLVGHADKINLQVRSVGEDGKIWVNADSYLPCTLLGHEAVIFSEDPANLGSWRAIRGGTVEAIGPIHFVKPGVRSGEAGIKPEQLYLEMWCHGADRKAQIENTGIRPGDVILLERPIRRGFSADSFYGSYLDNGLGCFAVTEVARLIAARGGLRNVRVLFALATHEEIGRMGSRVLAGIHRPDVLIAIDVNFDFDATPGVQDRHFPPIEMGKGFTFGVGSMVSEQLNRLIMQAANEAEIPFQRDPVGRDPGTDSVAAAFAAIDAAATTIGFPVRNMHTVSEGGHTGDVLAAIHVLDRLLTNMDQANEGRGLQREDLASGHARLDMATPVCTAREITPEKPADAPTE